MMDAVLMSMVWLVGTVVNYALGAVLFAIAVVLALTAARWLLGRYASNRSGEDAAVLQQRGALSFE